MNARNEPSPTRAGYVLIEFLMVVSIIGLALSFLIPATLRTREAARRSQCVNNLKQIALALENYQSAFDVLPPGAVVPDGCDEPSAIGWYTQLLPYMEQSMVWHATNTQVGWDDAQNVTAANAHMNTLLCPSDGRNVAPTGLGVSNYAGCHHDLEAPIGRDDHGVFFRDSAVRREMVLDGTSNTVYVGEKLLDAPEPGWMSGGRATLRNTGSPPNATPEARPPGPVGGFASRHPLGVHFAFGDGSVRLIHPSISLPLYQRLGHRADGELIDGAF